MSEHLNAATLRAFYLSFDHEDYVERVRAFLAPNVTWHVAGDNALAGEY